MPNPMPTTSTAPWISSTQACGSGSSIGGDGPEGDR
jgi:hypothetical protein